MANIDMRLDAWKNKLLDLGKRNKLINYKDTKRSNLRIVSPLIYELWNSFVVNEEPIEFPYIEEELTVPELEGDERKKMPAGLVTNQSLKEQQRTLKSLREKSKIAIEEQGINVLYLSFGFLRWQEADHSEQYLLSPLILVPVSLSVDSIIDPYILSLHEDEIIVNPTLAYKLEHDFGIILPEFDLEQNISEYFDTIKEMTRKNKWDVTEDVTLSLLSFLKINMYNDLEKHKDKVKNNSIVKALCGDRSMLEYNTENIMNFDHDRNTKPMDLFQVVDADSSQQDAILCAKKGISFVLQGPPGTGKSQTITNIIAECMADGKKILFVSEKMAALDVVRRRLTSAGLEDFCLTLHSYKANKREILDQLGVVLNLTQKKASISDEAYQKLDLLQSDKEKLNEYSEAIFTKVMPLEKTIYQVNGYLAHLEDCPEIIFNIPDISGTTAKKFNSYINLLNQFNDTVGRMSDSYKLNPWNSANVSNVSNELRHDIGANLNKLLPKIAESTKQYDEIEHNLGISITSSYDGLSELTSILFQASKSPIVPTHWIVGDDITPLFAEIDEYAKLQKQFMSLKAELSILCAQIQSYDNQALIDNLDSLITVSKIEKAIEGWKRFIQANDRYSFWNNVDYITKASCLFDDARIKINEYNRQREELLVSFENDIFEIDYKGILSRYKTDYASFFKIFKKQYKLDRKQLIGKYKEMIKKVSDTEIIATLTKLRQINELELWMEENNDELSMHFGKMYQNKNTNFKEIEKMLLAYKGIQRTITNLLKLKTMAQLIEEKVTVLKSHYDFLYTGICTDWDVVYRALCWANDFRKLVTRNSLDLKFVKRVCDDKNFIITCDVYARKIEQTIKNINIELNWFISLFDEKQVIKESRMPALYDRVNRCMNGLSLLEEWIDFRTVIEKGKAEGLGDYFDKIIEHQLDASLIINIFKKRYYRLWLDAILPNYPVVMNFRRKSHEGIINEFAYLDKLQFDIAKARIRKQLIDSLPSLDRFTSGADEISILKRELGKFRRIMPLRKLFKCIPNLLLTLKPCLMMSPLSVSLFLEADSYDFDVVIFDEASQVCTENAIGAIARGKQVIIAGDSKQLPPTNFFTAATTDSDYDSDDEEEYDDVNAYESILDEALLLPERTLLWHYRSRHEHLIAFSNAKIYKNSLVTFPSNVDKVSDNGVEYVYVEDGFYDRGGKKGNVIEAQKVATMVFEHFRKYPNRSLGIIAFGEVQQRAIDAAIRQMRINNQSYEHFFREDAVEAFFVKNLENVQGDERDTIIFSIGYAKSQQGGMMQMQFGPLSKAGGERRLNVAITRAKHNVKLVGSIMPTDIDLNRISTEGPKLLRSYIEFAIHGPVSILRETTESDVIEHDSPFEEAVYNFLNRKGYRLGTQVGCSGYRIDMAVKHPTLSGRYVLGIECDGAAYHSARTARERDRLRQAVLEDMGWKIYRIWSTDWIKDPVTEGEKLISAVEKSIMEFVEEGIEGVESSDSDAIQETPDFLKLDKKERNLELESNPYGFTYMRETDFSKIPRDMYGHVSVEDCIMMIINNEYPVHYDSLCRSLAFLWGNEKATVKVRNEINFYLDKLNRKIIVKDNFLYPVNYQTIKPKSNNTRPIDLISTEELAEAMIRIANVCIGPTLDTLCTETARSYGYGRNTNKVTTAMKEAYGVLLQNGRLKEMDGKVVIS